jgi:hypothetical protein
MLNLEWQKRQDECRSKLDAELERDIASVWSMYLMQRISDGINGITCLETYKFSITKASLALFRARFCIKLAYSSDTSTT